MKKACLFVSKPYQQNNIFQENDRRLNRDNCLAPFCSLRKRLATNEIDLSTQDINSAEASLFTIYNDVIIEPRRKNDYLLLMESEIIAPQNWNIKKWQEFRGVFTWSDQLVDGIRFHKVNFSNHFEQNISLSRADRARFCTMIIGNKTNSDPRELYSERRRVIQWFENNAPDDFDLYGMGWDRRFFSGSAKLLNRIPWFCKIGVKCPQSFMGFVDSKLETYRKYKFAICFENAKDISGYITEKIFDCLIAGVIPVYYGAPDILKFIPKQCFIDFRDFLDYRSLYQYMKTMSGKDYEDRLTSIELFLNSSQCSPYSDVFFANQITNIVLRDCGQNAKS